MHFVTGGAFNGKAKWVKEYFQLENNPHLWFSAYQDEDVPENTSEWNEMNIVVLEGVEAWAKLLLLHENMEKLREIWKKLLNHWLAWEESDQSNTLVIIGTDITKGIVPMLPEERSWRDVTGWLYQDTVKAAERVDLIWYGIHQQLK